MLDQNQFKSLFETPQKARLTILCSLVAAATLVAIIIYAVYSLRNPGADAPPSQSEAVSESVPPSESLLPDETGAPTQELVGIVPYLTIDAARELALADAGVAEDEANVSREALAEDNGIWVYEFRFRTETARYEYKLNANTGEVRSMVKESIIPPSAGASDSPAPESAPAGQATPQPSNPSMPAQSSTPAASRPPAGTPAPVPSQSASMYIGVDRAKAIALEHAGLSASETTFTKAGMDREHGKMVYEIEFRQGRTKYEYEIDASTGSILSYEREGASEGRRPAPSAPAAAEPSAPVYISTEQAKAIALEHAGLSASETTFTKAGMDREHGKMVYEIEFRQSRTEYEYEIDASTGTILSFEQDTD